MTVTTPLHGEGMPLHRQLFLVLRDQIRRGTYAPFDALPSEQVLGSQFGVSRITVRRALQDLADEGLVERQHGRGTFVRGYHEGTPDAPVGGLIEGLRRTHMDTTAELIDLAVRPAPPPTARHLSIEPGDPALNVVRVRHGPTGPLMITESWVPARFATVVTAEVLASRPLYQVLIDAGVAFGRVVQEITAEVADPNQATLLDTVIGSPLLRLNRVVHDMNDLPVQYLSLFMSPSRSHVLMEIPASELDTANSGRIVHDTAPAVTRSSPSTRRRAT